MSVPFMPLDKPKTQTPDINVINESLIMQSIMKERKEVEMERRGKAAREDLDSGPVVVWDPVVLPKLDALSLSFANLHKIENLGTLSNLETLRLDNNCITEIRGLNLLVKLKWLDLSFNKIAKIEGLEALTELRDLSLFSNRIATIEGLDSLQKLEVLSLGSNKIGRIEELKVIRPLNALKVLNMDGNPVVTVPEYRNMAVTILPQLHYLDYTMITEQERKEASDLHLQLISELREAEAPLKSMEAKKREQEARAKRFKAAGVYVIASIPDNLAQNTEEDEKRLHRMPGITAILEKSLERVKGMIDEVVAMAEKTAKRMNGEQEGMEYALSTERKKADDQSRNLVIGMESVKKRIGRMMDNDDAEFSQMMAAFREMRGDNEQLRRQLLRCETSCHENCLAIQDMFESEYRNISQQRMETFGNFFRALEKEQTNCREELTMQVMNLVEEVANGRDFEGTLDDETMAILRVRLAAGAMLRAT